jgi:parallel beta-helix repeat protein
VNKLTFVSLSLGVAGFCNFLNGATVTVPAGASIQAAADANPAGTVIQLSPGVYRMQSVFPKNGDQIIGALDAAGNRLTTLSGAQALSSFTKDGYGNFVATTTQTQPGQETGECEWGYARCRLPEDLFFDNKPFKHNGVGPQALAAGEYFFDYPAGKIYFRPLNAGDDPATHVVEYSRARVAIAGTNISGVTVRNLIVEKYAIPAQFGAIGDQYPGQAWTVQNNEVRFNHGIGIRVSDNSQVLDNYTHDNGQMGMGGNGKNILVQGNEIAHNIDYAGIACWWECGGFKFAFTDTLTIRGNSSHDNVGPGMWTDLDNIHTIYENNTVANNTGPGIFHEISYDAIIRGNTLKNNGAFAPDDWFWNGQIQISTSQNVEIYGNFIEVNSMNNGNGIMLIQQNRTNDPCSFGPCKVANTYVHDNHITVTGNRWHGATGAAQDFIAYGDIYFNNNRFESNHYHVPDVNSAAYWDWMNSNQSFNGFRSFGLEVNGTVDSNISGDAIAPAVPSSIFATAVSDSQINVTWSPAIDNVGVTGYRVYRGGAQIGTTQGTSFNDTGLAPRTAYTYSVAASDAAGNVSAQSAGVNATTAGDTTAPSVPGGLNAVAVSGSQINLTWSAATDNVGVTGYRIYRSGSQIGTSATTSYSDNGLALSASYTYSVAAYDAAGNISGQSFSFTATTKGDTTAPTAPGGLSGSAVSTTQIALNWNAATDNVGVTGYRVYRNGVQVGTPAGTSYTDGGLVTAAAYNYSVAAVDAAGNVSGQSATISVTTQGDKTPPSVPGGLSATAVSPSQISLNWGAATDNIGVAGYRVFRNGGQIGTTAGTSYTDGGLNASTAYTYSVAAYDAAGNVSGLSAMAGAVTKSAVVQRGARVITTTRVTVRSKAATNASAKSLGEQAQGSTGTITQNSQVAGGVVWWYVNFDSGADGWVPQSSIAAL